MALFRRTREATRARSAAPSSSQDPLAEELAIVQAVHRFEDENVVLTLGTPSRCPKCGAIGYVEGVNGLKGTSFNHCLACRTAWVITERALRAYERLLEDAARLRARSDAAPDGPDPAGDNPWIEGDRAGEFVRVQADLEVEITAGNASLADRYRPCSDSDSASGGTSSRGGGGGGGVAPSVHFA